MAIKIPTHFMGVPVNDETLKKVLDEKTNPSQKAANSINPSFISPKNLVGAKYIQIPGANILIAKEETYKGKNWTDTHYALSDEGLFMPSPKLFVPYFINVRDASQGKVQLYDGNNRPLSTDETEDLWKYLSTNHRNGCWTWLDAMFLKDNSDVWGLETDYRVQVLNGKKELIGKRANLEAHVGEDCFVELDFNSQGLPTKTAKDSTQKYSQGQNIYFYQPRPNRVARFGAGSRRAYLNCDGNPTDSSSALGVFACAEGAAVAKT